MNGASAYILFMKLLGCFMIASSFTAIYIWGVWGFMTVAMIGVGTCAMAIHDERRWGV